MIGKPLALGFKYGIFKPGAKVAGIGLKAVDKAVVSPITYLGSKAIPAPVKQIRNASNYVINKALTTIKNRNRPKKQLPEFERMEIVFKR